MPWKKVLLEGDAAALSDTAPVNVTKDTAAAGSANAASRQDHKHNISTAVVGSISENASPAEGTATSLARADHVHGSPASWSPSAHVLSGHSAATGVVNFGQQQADGLVLEAVATPPDSGTEAEGQVYFDTTAGDKHVYVWVA